MSLNFSVLKANLQNDIKTSSFKNLFRKHNPRIDPTGNLISPELVIIFLQTLDLERRELKDRILFGIFTAFRIDPDPLWMSFLTLIFLPMLSKLYNRKSFYEDSGNTEDLWQQLYWCFLQTIHNLDPGRRPRGIAAKVKNDTRKRLYEHYRAQWESRKAYRGMFDLVREIEPIVREHQLHRRHPFPEDEDEKKMERLDELSVCLKAGIIKDSEYQLLVAAEVEGYPVRYLSQKYGISYEALKKRRQRALTAVQKFLE